MWSMVAGELIPPILTKGCHRDDPKSAPPSCDVRHISLWRIRAGPCCVTVSCVGVSRRGVRRCSVALVVVPFLAALAACGGSSDGGSSSATESSTGTEAPTGTAGGSSDDVTAAVQAEVDRVMRAPGGGARRGGRFRAARTFPGHLRDLGPDRGRRWRRRRTGRADRIGRTDHPAGHDLEHGAASAGIPRRLARAACADDRRGHVRRLHGRRPRGRGLGDGEQRHRRQRGWQAGRGDSGRGCHRHGRADVGGDVDDRHQHRSEVGRHHETDDQVGGHPVPRCERIVRGVGDDRRVGHEGIRRPDRHVGGQGRRTGRRRRRAGLVGVVLPDAVRQVRQRARWLHRPELRARRGSR